MSGLLYEGWMILAALLPSIGLLYLFYVVMKHVVEGDRRERAALRAAEQAERDAHPDGSDGPAKPDQQPTS
ncbi:hypothetical protein SGUI_1452 [Serinicoccus hydrothermalis]|uniref:Uncharacterized protein n=1 Tax=Serinicoccus hydrothermalis TaxID=1758689 RepID=A0A1B1NBN3_9MICO|nr:hypothetical protein SGUI_1452 [Serinicoccus hydrothermalis]